MTLEHCLLPVNYLLELDLGINLKVLIEKFINCDKNWEWFIGRNV